MTEENERIAGKRKAILELGETLGNVSEACRRAHITRTQFYKYRKRFQELGLKGLENLPPVHRSHPMTTPPDVVARLVALSFAHPSWGCVRLSAELRQAGIAVSPPTVQKALAHRGMGNARDRWLRLEERAQRDPTGLTPEQLTWVEHWNPAFRERARESSRPGELIVQDVRAATPRERIYVHVAVDTFGGLAFGILRTRRDTAGAAELLTEKVFPFYERTGYRITSLVTPDVPLFWGSRRHPLERLLAAVGIEHRSVHRDPPRKNGFLERFWRDIQSEFVAPRRAEWMSVPVGRWQEEFLTWLEDYNNVRPYLGYRNMGVPPLGFVRKTVNNEG